MCDNCKLEKTRTLDDKVLEVLAYCQPYTDVMWSAKVISILLECDFRDAREKVNKYLSNNLDK